MHSIDRHRFTAATIHFLQTVTYLLAAAIERKRAEALLAIQTQILENIASGINLLTIYKHLCLLFEQ